MRDSVEVLLRTVEHEGTRAALRELLESTEELGYEGDTGDDGYVAGIRRRQEEALKRVIQAFET